MRLLFFFFIVPFLISACVSSQTTTTQNNPNGLKSAFNSEVAAETRMQLALLYLENNQMQLAKENLDIALQYQPNSAKIVSVLAYYYQQVNEDGEAEKYYKKSIALDPENGDTYHNYASFLCAKGFYKKGEDLFLKAVALPHYLRVEQTYQNAAICAEEERNYNKAILYAEYALSHNPNNINLNLFLAKLNINVKKYEAAKLNLFTFEHSSSSTAESLWQWIRLDYAEGDKASLSKHGEQLERLFPGTPQVLNYVNKKYYD
jgi:type IV pilus assembly protein PilF